MTTREVKQIVAERKDPAPTGGHLSAQEYLKAREEEDEHFRDLMWRFRDRFADCLRVCDSRQDGIFSLKERFKYSASHDASGGWYGSPKGLTAYGADKKAVERTWTETWDHLAVIALQDAGKRKAEPEGHLMISGWMPGGTNPGHPCVCAVLMDFRGDGELKRAFYRWTGKRWEFDVIDEEVAISPTKWMEIPEVEA